MCQSHQTYPDIRSTVSQLELNARDTLHFDTRTLANFSKVAGLPLVQNRDFPHHANNPANVDEDISFLM